MPRTRRIVALLLILLVALLASAQDKRIAKRIDALLAQPDVARAFWGVEIVSLDSGKTLYSYNADKLFIPASNTKLFTTAAALGLIGPDYRFKTTLETTGALDRYGRLTGDLVIVGRGDPNLSGRALPFNVRAQQRRALEELADSLVQKGVKFVDGDVIADDSYFAFERYGDGWAQDDLAWDWGAPVSALTINDNVVTVNMLPADRSGERAFVSLSPFPEYYKVDNRIITTPAGTGPRKITINREPGSDVVTLWGNIPLDDAGAQEYIAIEDPAEFAVRYFRRLLEQRGISIFGNTRTRHTELARLSTFSVTATASAGDGDSRALPPTLPPNTVLATLESAPLIDDLRVVNKVSQNLHAELLLRLLGREKGAGGTVEGGLEVVRGFLLQAGVDAAEYVFFDGSGLSRRNLVTPHAVVKLLKFVSAQPWGLQFQDTLPISSVDGTLSERYKTTAAQGRVHAKTGSLGHVNALSGFATTVRGERIVFSVMTNNHKLTGRRALDTIDAIVEAVIDDAEHK